MTATPVEARGSPRSGPSSPDRPPVRPRLATGPSSAAILGSDGSFSLPWNTRGAAIDWGGVYAQGVRLAGPWSLAFGPAGHEIPLGPATVRSQTHDRWIVESTHQLADLDLVDTVLPLPDLSGVGRRLSVRSMAATAGDVRVVMDLPLWLAPVLIEGVRPYDFELRTSMATVFARSHGWALGLESDPLPSTLAIDGVPWIGGGWSGEARSLRVEYALSLDPGRVVRLDWVLWGGLLATVDANPDAGRAALASRESWEARNERTWTSWRTDIPKLSTPDDPALSDAYRLAADALRSLYADPTPDMAGLVAGFPWYSDLWFRDIGWMLPAVLWLGDVDRVRRTVATAFRYQAPADLGLLGATAGELPMQLSAGPVFLFGTSDTTLYFPLILQRLVAHTGDASVVEPFRKGLARALAWGNLKVDPKTGLFTNGGEVAAIKKAAIDIGRVHYGIDAFDTTIWDSADRRDHAIDLQVLWAEALDAFADLDELSGGRDAPPLHQRAAAVRAEIASRYRWPAEKYLYDSLHTDGSPLAHVRPNALRAVEAGIFDSATAGALLDRAAQPDLSTPWGLRTLSSSDATYDPIAYHEGQVWTIATAWAAGASFRAGRPEAGVRYLDTIAARVLEEDGFASECYRGDRPEAFDSCFLLGFSVGPFLTTIFEGLWGLRPALRSRTLSCRPRFPASWSSASLTGIRLGGGRLDLGWRPGAVTARWAGPWPLMLAGERGSVQLDPDAERTLAVP
ncbi:MAG: hypothetical protein L3K18_03290 [Thermoplasmata archaeon]|nr:hypothetical protein [Thermoplasmata archaeon]MCI4356156.1 hypothetical protein [Thermoplasmata archaeon]